MVVETSDDGCFYIKKTPDILEWGITLSANITIAKT